METVSVNSGAFRRSRALPSARVLILAFAVTLFVVFCGLPIIYMFLVSLTDAAGTFTLDNYRQLLTESRQRELLLTSTVLGAGSALVATTLGAPLGLLLARTRLPVKRFLRVALVIPLVVPPYIMAVAWILVTGPTGLLSYVAGPELLLGWTYSLTGAIIVLGLSFYPLSMLATESAARRVDGRLEEAGLLVGNARRVLWRITLPLIAPTTAATAVIIFVLALSEFGVPGLLRVRVFTTEVFTAFAALYDFGAGVALATPMLAVAVIAGVVVKLITGERMLATRRSVHPGLSFPHFRAPALIGIGLVIVTAVLFPLAALFVEAKGVGGVASATRTSRDAITNSLSLSIISALLIVALGLMIGYGRARARTRFRSLFDLVLIVIFAIPSTVAGVGLIGLWNRPGLLGAIYSSSAIIVVAYLARFVPVAALVLAANVRQVSTSLEEAAEIAGARWPRTFARIVLPNMRGGIAAALVVAFIFSFGELGATILVAPPGESTLPVRVYTLIANTPPSEVAALALMQVSIILVPLTLLGLFARDEGKGQRL